MHSRYSVYCSPEQRERAAFLLIVAGLSCERSLSLSLSLVYLECASSGVHAESYHLYPVSSVDCTELCARLETRETLCGSV